MDMMTPSRPYLLRAIREWIQDNGLTPYILVQASYPGTVVPEPYIENDRIVLNLSSQATAAYQLDNDWLFFEARFSGRSMDVQVPVAAILAIYARENGEGMVFENADMTATPVGSTGENPAAGESPEEKQTETGSEEATDAQQPAAKGKKPRPGKRPHLKLIKH